MRFNEKYVRFLAKSRKADKEGRLSYKTQKESYRQKWVRLQGNMLFYYRLNDKGMLSDSEPQYVFVLERYTVKIEQNADAPFAFSLLFAGDGPERKHIFSGQTLQACQEWVECIKKASMEHLQSYIYDLQAKIISITGKDPLIELRRNPHRFLGRPATYHSDTQSSSTHVTTRPVSEPANSNTPLQSGSTTKWHTVENTDQTKVKPSRPAPNIPSNTPTVPSTSHKESSTFDPFDSSDYKSDHFSMESFKPKNGNNISKHDLFDQPVKSDPFGQPSKSDPFEETLQSDPFAQPLISDPFAQPLKSDPFAQSLKSDPFVQTLKSDPFEQPLKSDPFAQSSKSDLFDKSLKSDPFEESSKFDPFEQMSTRMASVDNKMSKDPFLDLSGLPSDKQGTGSTGANTHLPGNLLTPAQVNQQNIGRHSPNETCATKQDPFGSLMNTTADPFNLSNKSDPFGSVATDTFQPFAAKSADPFNSKPMQVRAPSVQMNFANRLPGSNMPSFGSTHLHSNQQYNGKQAPFTSNPPFGSMPQIGQQHQQHSMGVSQGNTHAWQGNTSALQANTGAWQGNTNAWQPSVQPVPNRTAPPPPTSSQNKGKQPDDLLIKF